MNLSISIPRISERSSVEIANIARRLHRNSFAEAYRTLLHSYALLRAPKLVK